jgi:hypothetical protein
MVRLSLEIRTCGGTLPRRPRTAEVCGVDAARSNGRRPISGPIGSRRSIGPVADDSRHFLETVLHAVLANRYRMYGEPGWEEFRVWMYAPEGDIRRALHTDGRKDAPERLVTVAYPGGETPDGAPAPVVDVPQ